MTDLVDTTEMYLRTILDLEEEAIVPLRARISERLGHSGPTVSQTIGRMERDGLVVVEGDRHLELTVEGRTPRHARDAQAPPRRAPARRRHRTRLGLRARRGLPLGARHERAGRAPPARAARPPDRVAVRQPDPRPRRARRQAGRPLPRGRRSTSSTAWPGRARRVDRRRSAGSASRCSSSPNCCSSSRRPASCPAPTASISAAGSYVLVQVEGHGEGLELPNEVAAHIYVGVLRTGSSSTVVARTLGMSPIRVSRVTSREPSRKLVTSSRPPRSVGGRGSERLVHPSSVP